MAYMAHGENSPTPQSKVNKSEPDKYPTVAVLTISDRSAQGLRKDLSGPAVVHSIHRLTGWNCTKTDIVSDNVSKISAKLSRWADEDKINLIITTGGTGLTGRDITPEVLDEIADKKIPGFGELFRQLSYQTVGTSTLQSRACAILKNGKYVFALPGSSGGVTDAWEMILKYQLDINHKPCNFVELFPRLKEK